MAMSIVRKHINGNAVKYILLYAILFFFTYLMLLITLQYFPIRYDVAFLRIKDEPIQLLHYKIAFFTHVYTSIIVLLFGIIQVSEYIRIRYSAIHKIIGKFYIAIILLLSAPSGLTMAYYANGGIIAQISFALLAILWFIFTFIAYQRIKKSDILSHRKFMYRSFALTLSAISLRLFKYIIVHLFHTPPMDTYRLVSWLGWIVNLFLLEFYFMIQKRRQ